MKKQLLWQLPLAGFACYLLGYPFMRRHTRAEVRKNPKLKGKDIETTKKACQMLKQHPATLINFVEGTRFTAAKHQRQESPYQHLLKPRAGGAAIVIEELHDCLAGILDVTISYDIEELSLWHLLCGRFKAINIHYELLPIPEDMIGDYYTDRRFRAQFQQWLNQIWEDKDRKITEFKNG